MLCACHNTNWCCHAVLRRHRGCCLQDRNACPYGVAVARLAHTPWRCQRACEHVWLLDAALRVQRVAGVLRPGWTCCQHAAGQDCGLRRLGLHSAGLGRQRVAALTLCSAPASDAVMSCQPCTTRSRTCITPSSPSELLKREGYSHTRP